MRRGEVAALTLDDIDWRAGEIIVRGKGQRIQRLPLPADVDAAIVYLRDARPAGLPGREVFMRPPPPSESWRSRHCIRDEIANPRWAGPYTVRAARPRRFAPVVRTCTR